MPKPSLINTGDYNLCGKSYVNKKYCQEYAVALLSPKDYADRENYPIRIYYEEIANWHER